jgi:hypothetical protein
MNLTLSIARGHALALAQNYRTANPKASTHDVADYVADEMTKFLRAHDARGIDSSVSFWYAAASASN